MDERVRGKVDRIEDLEFRFEKKIQDAANITISKDDKEPSSRYVESFPIIISFRDQRSKITHGKIKDPS